MRMVAAIGAAQVLSVLAFFGAGTADAAEIKMLVSNAMKTTMEELAPQFEKASEHKLAITFGATSELKASIEKGEAFDVTILTAAAIDDLVKQGKASAAGRADIARAAFGMAARKGAPKPDISTTAAFKQALLDAKSIAYVEGGAGAPYLRGVFERLGIADQIKSKTKLLPTINPAANAVANGEAEFGITAVSEILPFTGAELVGQLPPEIQFYSVSAAAIAANTKEPDAGKALIKFLTAPAAATVLKAKGLDPV
jgi:molybdate transport system substrate-binding protein